MIAHSASASSAPETPAIPTSRRQNRYSFWLVHLACLAVLFTGVSVIAVAVCLAFYLVRMFAITGWYHRYFSHHAFKASRPVQFLFAALGCTAAQKGPLWWASHHREHHAFTDTPQDPHSPSQQGFWYSHMLWFLDPRSHGVREARIRDFLAFPELRWLERYHWVAIALSMAGLYLLGHVLGSAYPGLGTNGPQMLVWGFFISTVLLYHGTFAVNSLGHTFGTRRYNTRDTSRNSAFVSLVSLGEGWHNNHHRFPLSARQGFFWWEFDPTWYALWMLERAHIIRELRGVPASIKYGFQADSTAVPPKSDRIGAEDRSVGKTLYIPAAQGYLSVSSHRNSGNTPRQDGDSPFQAEALHEHLRGQEKA